MDRLEKQLQFIVEIDKLKSVYRRTYLIDGERRENSAEHSWHLAMLAMVLSWALFRTQQPTHLSISEAVSAAQRVGARQTWLTHLTHRTSHAELEAELPAGIAPAFDGLTVEIA
jgi:phosphoribosyl 1,2-cyclic phosphodiesterase